jgi:hypothetical protein
VRESKTDLCGESRSVNEEDVGAWKMGVLPSLSEYHPKDVFNVD